ncbi:5-methyltetrahydropteroyltriglutamate--homocysteine S-methyltransferase [Haliovirga abyssi]|uniref:5-methyltetrahydropteroyltriglutamate--homocysteine methyltransferase n=1 Tax=Haliovirga abyssi TaxID=2996794 RepID=A0AAU9DMN8_9FUSO|nr:5-methyltetrahydropteroyltriglutamate--homocysteine S-methyltransferase [Haliovirga abyssi]BDU51297.1 5-methyltetrahydropteroyltriglutamate--homocysteine methyltransferase [Haliovirga abyssi]
MVKISTIGFPRIGEKRELKKLVESYLKNEISQNELELKAKKLKERHWKIQKNNGIEFISSNDFSYYDTMLDTMILINAIPTQYKELGLNELDTYFAMAKGYQSGNKDVKALAMKKWFNTNYHYLVPELKKDMEIKLNGNKIFYEYLEAKKIGVDTKPVLIGPLTFLKLSKISSEESYDEYVQMLTSAYIEVIDKLNELGVEYLQIEEPILVTDLTEEDIKNFKLIYNEILKDESKLKIILQTYFGDVRDIYRELLDLNFYGIGLDFVEGEKNLELIDKYGFSENKTLFVGLVNGKNIWKNDYKKSIDILNKIKKYTLVINTSCSLLHVPYTLKSETKLAKKYKRYLAFAEEKLKELEELKELFCDENYKENSKFIQNQGIIKDKKELAEFQFEDVRNEVKVLKEEDFNRKEKFEERIIKQKEVLNLPKLPTTTIGSFPQTVEIRKIRRKYKNGDINSKEYEMYIKEKIKNVIQIQEEIDLDVLVHGEFERTDMVEYFGEYLEGFLITENGWVQSYGTRGVKPPIIFGDIKRKKAFTVDWISYAQSLTKKPLKGMLTGPITILNWSFPREDLPLEEIAYQIGLAIQEEVLDLERAGIKIIQIDEAALREKLPIRKKDWKEKYLDWAIKAFKVTNFKVDLKTQIHTHMCYSEFEDIISEIKSMDADVITIEAAKSDLSMLDVLAENNYDKEIGPGVYDIHSPRVPGIDEFKIVIKKIIEKNDLNKLWINPDCGLKTRAESEAIKSLKNMVASVKEIRKEI